jgi:hypothetical protein
VKPAGSAGPSSTRALPDTSSWAGVERQRHVVVDQTVNDHADAIAVVGGFAPLQ